MQYLKETSVYFIVPRAYDLCNLFHRDKVFFLYLRENCTAEPFEDFNADKKIQDISFCLLRLLFWINNKTPTPSIGSSTLTGANVKVYKIVTSSQPRDLNIDTTQRMIYWLSNKGVERMSYFGTSKKTFVHPAGISVANSLTVSATKGML